MAYDPLDTLKKVGGAAKSVWDGMFNRETEAEAAARLGAGGQSYATQKDAAAAAAASAYDPWKAQDTSGNIDPYAGFTPEQADMIREYQRLAEDAKRTRNPASAAAARRLHDQLVAQGIGGEALAAMDRGGEMSRFQQDMEALGGPNAAAWQDDTFYGVDASYNPHLDRILGGSAEANAAWGLQGDSRGLQGQGLDMLRGIASGDVSAVRPELAYAREQMIQNAASQAASARGANRLAALRGSQYASAAGQADLGARGASALAQERMAGMTAFNNAASNMRQSDIGAYNAASGAEQARNAAWQQLWGAGMADKDFNRQGKVDYEKARMKQRHAVYGASQAPGGNKNYSFDSSVDGGGGK